MYVHKLPVVTDSREECVPHKSNRVINRTVVSKTLGMAEANGGLVPQGWVHHPSDSSWTSRTGRKLKTPSEVHHHLKEELTEAKCNPDELQWLRTLNRYGPMCRHWASAKAAASLPEAPTFYPTMEEFQDPARYVRSVLHKINQYGMCKVVPPDGWTPPPWSGRPPKGAASRSTFKRGSARSVEATCRALNDFADDNLENPPCDLKVTPRLQPIRLFNKSFEYLGGDLSLTEYRDLCDAVWPSDTPCGADSVAGIAEAEKQFWDLMAGNAPKEYAMYASQLRVEARTYQKYVQSQQTIDSNPPNYVNIDGGSHTALVLPELPWELQGAPPIMAVPARLNPHLQNETPFTRERDSDSDRCTPTIENRCETSSSQADIDKHQTLVGRWVRVCGLSKRPELNGASAFVHSFDVSLGRFRVQFQGIPKLMAMRSVNLELLSGELKNETGATTGLIGLMDSAGAAESAAEVGPDSSIINSSFPKAAVPVSLPKTISVCKTSESNGTSSGSDEASSASASGSTGSSWSGSSGTSSETNSTSTRCNDASNSNDAVLSNYGTPSSRKKSEGGGALKRKKRMCATPGCTFEEFHLGMCTQEAAQESLPRRCRSISSPTRTSSERRAG